MTVRSIESSWAWFPKTTVVCRLKTCLSQKSLLAGSYWSAHPPIYQATFNASMLWRHSASLMRMLSSKTTSMSLFSHLKARGHSSTSYRMVISMVTHILPSGILKWPSILVRMIARNLKSPKMLLAKRVTSVSLKEKETTFKSSWSGISFKTT